MGFSKKILVPVDFTKVSDIAIEHSLLMGKTILANIHLIHIVENKKQVSEARLKLDALKDRIRVENGVEIHTHVRIGNIFEDIDKAATEMDAALIIMGTHGARGLQFMFKKEPFVHTVTTVSLFHWIFTKRPSKS
jgi:nucleotide-binding universal stress UspA family protein